MVSREVTQGTQRQGVDESIYYGITTTPWGSTPTSVTVTAWSLTGTDTWTNVSTTVLSGTASVAGDVIILPKLYSLTQGVTYRIEVKFTSGANIFEPYFYVQAER